MMQRSSEPEFRSQNEDGIMLVVIGGVIVSILILLGLAVDSGSLYYGQLAAQSAADAAVSSGAALYAEKGASQILKITEAMEKMSLANLELNRIPATNVIDNRATIDSAAGTLHIDVIVNIRLRILGWVPGFTKLGKVAAAARARVRPAAIALMLDTSYSMCCPAAGGFCAPSDYCPEAGSRMAHLKEAVNTFINHFDPNRDNISLIPFALGAEVLVPFRPRGTGFPLAEMQAQVAGLRPGGATNPSDAFLRGYLEAARIGAQREVAYVYFSDGAPSAARFLFDPTAIGSLAEPFANNVLGYPWSNYDYLSWANYVKIGETYASLPYFFVGTPGPSGWNPRLHTAPLAPQGAFVIGKDDVEVAQGPGLLQRYLNYISLKLPDGSNVRVGLGWSSSGAGFRWDLVQYREEYFNYALALADFARREGGSWYTVGLGDAAGTIYDASGQLDPYQNADQDFDRKDIFLTRLANDSCGMVRGDPNFPGFIGYSQLAKEGRREGVYLATPSADELSDLFEAIARQIKMRLIE